MRALPTGTVTFLFTDIEGSTRLLETLGPDRYAAALAAHREVIRSAVKSHDGAEVDTEGDAILVAFGKAVDALHAAGDAQSALADGPVRVRMGIHTGSPLLTDEGYVGPDLHLGARVGAAGHGGQVLVSRTTWEQVAGDASIELVDLGEHRVKDFTAPVWIYQLGSNPFPPLRTISNTNLPRPPSTFVGRESQVAELVGRIRNGARLVTLTGPGGAGKTRLAIETASELVSEFANGVFWVPLSALRDASLVINEIARTIGATEEIVSYIGERRMLIVLDNLEQVIDAARDLSTLLAACPNLRLLVTSREQLRVAGETQYGVTSLTPGEAEQLFCARASTTPSDIIRELCARLDNLPLAVELAAARASVLTPAQILERLSARLDVLKGGRDTDPRQQTLRAAIAWSYESLTESESNLYARLAIFRGGWSLESAVAVCDAEIDDLQGLVDKSLVVHFGERFSMLETIREYAVERLGASQESASWRARHAEYFLGLAEKLEPQQRGNPKAAFDVLELEHDNLRAAFDGLVEMQEGERALRLCTALSRFWSQRGPFADGKRRFQVALAMVPDHTFVRARGLLAAVPQATTRGDVDAATWANEGLAVAEEIGDAWGIAYGRFAVANAFADSGLPAKARPMFEQSIVDFERVGDDHLSLVAMTNAAAMSGELGDTVRERQLHACALDLARRAGNFRMQARALLGLAQNAIRQGDYVGAAPWLAAALRLYDLAGGAVDVMGSMMYASECLANVGRFEPAALILFAALREMDRLEVVDADFVDAANATLALIESALDPDAIAGARLRADSMDLVAAAKLASEDLESIAQPG